jgi:hypothetical protein
MIRLQKKKDRAGGPFFLFPSISSGYQVEGINAPNMLGEFGGEVIWNVGLLLWSFAQRLDKKAAIAPPG